MSVMNRGVRNAFRNGIRTFSLVVILGLSIGLALTMLVARSAVQAKINSVKSSIGNTITVSPAGSRGFQGGGEPLTDAQMAQIKVLPHVTGITETLNDRLGSTQTNLVSAVKAGSLGRRFRGGNTSGNAAGGTTSFTPPVLVTGVNTLNGSVLTGGGTVKLSSGSIFDPTKDANVALIGKGLAAKNSLSAGSTFTAYGTTFTVAGIFDAGNTFSNNALVMPLPTVQRLSQQVGDVSRAIVQVDSIDNLGSTTSAIQNSLGATVADVTNTQTATDQALQPLQSIKTISLYSLIGAVIAGSAIILLTMMMIVRERRREIGVLKAIGASNVKVTAQFMAEAVTLTLLGAIVGLGIGVIAANPVTQVLVTSSTNAVSSGVGGGRGGGGFHGAGRVLGLGAQGLHNVQASVGWSLLLYGLAAALIIAIVGSAIPAFLISKIRPAEVMRAE